MTPTSVEYLGIVAVALMVIFYWLENRHPAFVLLFALACVLAATYAWLIDSYPFFVAEGIWSLIALQRWYGQRRLASVNSEGC